MRPALRPSVPEVTAPTWCPALTRLMMAEVEGCAEAQVRSHQVVEGFFTSKHYT